MSSEAISFIKQQKPDVIFTLFHQIIKKEIIDIPEYGIINIHPGVLPYTKGIQPYFWNLVSSQQVPSGATLHYISDESIDTGAMIAQTIFQPWKKISVQLNYFLTIQSISSLLSEIVYCIENHTISPVKQDESKGSYYTWPDTESIDNLYAKGYRILSLVDLLYILLGKYDNFKAEHQKIYLKE